LRIRIDGWKYIFAVFSQSRSKTILEVEMEKCVCDLDLKVDKLLRVDTS